jgi:hypothetical protein
MTEKRAPRECPAIRKIFENEFPAILFFFENGIEQAEPKHPPK